jgi:hypothetical protein
MWKKLYEVVHRLAFELRRVSERETHERKKVELRLANQLLRFERRLPPSKADDYDKDMD